MYVHLSTWLQSHDLDHRAQMSNKRVALPKDVADAIMSHASASHLSIDECVTLMRWAEMRRWAAAVAHQLVAYTAVQGC
jgi:hypothetical protein